MSQRTPAYPNVLIGAISSARLTLHGTGGAGTLLAWSRFTRVRLLWTQCGSPPRGGLVVTARMKTTMGSDEAFRRGVEATVGGGAIEPGFPRKKRPRPSHCDLTPLRIVPGELVLRNACRGRRELKYFYGLPAPVPTALQGVRQIPSMGELCFQRTVWIGKK